MSNQQDPAAASAPFDSPSSHAVVGRRAQGEPRTIEVVAKRFSFEPGRVEVTEGERVRLVVKSGDGVHGVEIKKFKVNKKIPRGGSMVIMSKQCLTKREWELQSDEAQDTIGEAQRRASQRQQ